MPVSKVTIPTPTPPEGKTGLKRPERRLAEKGSRSHGLAGVGPSTVSSLCRCAPVSLLCRCAPFASLRGRLSEHTHTFGAPSGPLRGPRPEKAGNFPLGGPGGDGRNEPPPRKKVALSLEPPPLRGGGRLSRDLVDTPGPVHRGAPWHRPPPPTDV